LSFGSIVATGGVTNHTHGTAAGDGGVLSETVTRMNTPTAQQWAIVKAVMFG